MFLQLLYKKWQAGRFRRGQESAINRPVCQISLNFKSCPNLMRPACCRSFVVIVGPVHSLAARHWPFDQKLNAKWNEMLASAPRSWLNELYCLLVVFFSPFLPKSMAREGEMRTKTMSHITWAQSISWNSCSLRVHLAWGTRPISCFWFWRPSLRLKVVRLPARLALRLPLALRLRLQFRLGAGGAIGVGSCRTWHGSKAGRDGRVARLVKPRALPPVCLARPANLVFISRKFAQFSGRLWLTNEDDRESGLKLRL